MTDAEQSTPVTITSLTTVTSFTTVTPPVRARLPKAKDGWHGNLYGCDGSWWGVKLVPILRGGEPTGDQRAINVRVLDPDEKDLEDEKI